MKQIVNNRYLKCYKFLSQKEMSFFLANQKVSDCLSIDEYRGNKYYCYVCHNSLTSEKEFALSFSSDYDEHYLNFLYWFRHDVYVLDTGRNVYLVSFPIKVVASFELSTPLIGLYLIDDDTLLILEEASLQVVNSTGSRLRMELFDLIEKFQLVDRVLSIQTSEGEMSFRL